MYCHSPVYGEQDVPTAIVLTSATLRVIDEGREVGIEYKYPNLMGNRKINMERVTIWGECNHQPVKQKDGAFKCSKCEAYLGFNWPKKKQK